MKLEFSISPHTPSIIPPVCCISTLLWCHKSLLIHTHQETSERETAVRHSSQPVNARVLSSPQTHFSSQILLKSMFFLLSLRAGTYHHLCSVYRRNGMSLFHKMRAPSAIFYPCASVIPWSCARERLAKFIYFTEFCFTHGPQGGRLLAKLNYFFFI